MKWLEAERIRAVYRKREVMKTTVYNSLDPGAFYLLTSRDRYMVRILRTFLTPTRTLQEIRILDVGCGDGGVLRRLVLLGARPENLCGIDLLEERIQHAQQVSPNIRFLVGNAETLPFEDESWDLVLMFMIMSSILDSEMQHRVAAEAMRVLNPNGAILWYDFWINPINPDTIGMPRARIRALFPGHPSKLRRITLAPPIARRLARISWPLCWALEAIPFLCTHYMGLIYKQ